jgi:hypothetical protein
MACLKLIDALPKSVVDSVKLFDLIVELQYEVTVGAFILASVPISLLQLNYFSTQLLVALNEFLIRDRNLFNFLLMLLAIELC